MKKWKASHMAKCTPMYVKEACQITLLIVHGTSSITTFLILLLYLLNSVIQMLIIFWTYLVISCISLPLNFQMYTYPHFGEGRAGKTLPFFQFTVCIIFPKKIWHLFPFPLLPKLNWMSCLCAPTIWFILIDWPV